EDEADQGEPDQRAGRAELRPRELSWAFTVGRHRPFQSWAARRSDAVARGRGGDVEDSRKNVQAAEPPATVLASSRSHSQEAIGHGLPRLPEPRLRAP